MNFTLARARVLVILILCLVLFQAYALGEGRADYTVSASDSSVSVTIQTDFRENFTSSPIPIYTLTLTGSNASAAEAVFTAALGNLVQGVTVSGLAITSSSSTNSTLTTVRFTLEGAASRERGAVKINMAWKSFKIASDILSGGVSLNLVGRYLTTSPILNQTSSKFFSWTYFLDGIPVPSTMSQQDASLFGLLDFSVLSPPLESWPQKFSLEGGPTTTLTNSLHHNMTVKEVIHDPSGPITGIYLAGYSHNIRISILGPATVVGDTIILDPNSLAPQTMTGLILIFPLIGLTTFLLERRVNRGFRPWAKKNRQKSKGS